MKSPLSLKMRAISLLSQREHSPSELRRKLLRIAAEMADAAALAASSRGASAGAHPAEPDDGRDSSVAEVESLLAWLQVQGYLSEARFVESRINARASRYGSLRIKQELAQHGLTLSAESLADLRASEAERAKAVWKRKFAGKTGAEDPAHQAKQVRFLKARGFSPDVVRRVLRSQGED